MVFLGYYDYVRDYINLIYFFIYLIAGTAVDILILSFKSFVISSEHIGPGFGSGSGFICQLIVFR